MKKIAIGIFLITLIPALSTAQTTEENRTDYRTKFMAGFRFGGNYSNVYDTRGEEFNTDPKAGWAVGAFLTIPINQLIGVQPEFMFSQKGFKGTGSILGAKYDLTRTSNFIDVPIFLALKPSEFITLLAGVQYSYLLSQTDAFKSGVTTIEQEREFLNENVRKNLFGLTAGFNINLKHLVLGVRAGYDMTSNNGDGTSSTPRYRSSFYQATIGYRFYQD